MYKYTTKNIDELIPYANNSRTHSEEQTNQIASSIKEFGFTNPVLIDEDNGLIAGHGRILAAKKLGINDIPCIALEGLTKAQKKAYVIADNQLALNSGWDMDMLKLELDSLEEMDFDIDLLGFDNEFLELLDTEDPKEVGFSDDGEYTKKITPPIYEITTDVKPEASSLFSMDKTNELIDKIKTSNISDKDKEFLINSAYRHTVFNYEDIAEYYAHSDKEVQALMEESALIIIDFNKALEGGFMNLSDEVAKQYKADHE